MTGSRFRELRDQLGLTQAQLAELTGGSSALLSNYETGLRKVPAKLALALEAVAEVNRLGGDIWAVSKRAKA